MMELLSKIFLHLFNISVNASWLILAVLLLRFLLKRAPKSLSVLLWALVALRLLLPFTIGSELSLLPSREVLPAAMLTSPTPTIDSGFYVVDRAAAQAFEQSLSPELGASVNPLQVWTAAAAALWLAGMAALLAYALLSCLRLRRRLDSAVLLRDNIWQSEAVSSPFVLGLLRPRVYIPFGLEPAALAQVLAHEQAHIKRRDHIWKPLAFGLLALYWFNPLIWLAFVLLCRDLELACDERVIAALDLDQKKAYTAALLSVAAPRPLLRACPLAFGEIGVKDRVKRVLNYQKPAFWLAALAVCALLVAALCFLTSPPPAEELIMSREALANLAWQRQSLEVEHPFGDLDGVSRAADRVSGPALSDFLDQAQWREKRLRSPLELSPDITIRFHPWVELRFYESEDLAMILCEDRWMYYRTQSGDYEQICELIQSQIAPVDEAGLAPAQPGPGQRYVSASCRYMNGILPFAEREGDSGYYYELGADSFSVISKEDNSLYQAVSNIEWGWLDFPWTDAEWAALYNDDNYLDEPSQLYRRMLYQPLGQDFCLLSMDLQLWLVEFRLDPQQVPYVWTIYVLRALEPGEG